MSYETTWVFHEITWEAIPYFKTFYWKQAVIFSTEAYGQRREVDFACFTLVSKSININSESSSWDVVHAS